MKIKTFILTFLLMSCPFLFGQAHWNSPTQTGENSMTVTSSIYLDDVLLTDNSYEIAAFCGNELRAVTNIETFSVNESQTLACVLPYFTGTNGEKIYFKLFNGTDEYVSVGTVTYVGDGEVGSFTDLFRIDFKAVAKIEGSEYGVVYPTLQEAINIVANGQTITLLADNAEDVTVVQAPDKAFTINGDNKNYTGTITVDGKSQAYATAGLTIKNVKFNTNNITKDASINLGGSNATRYTNGVTVDNCTFTGTGKAKVGVKNYTGGCKNLTITDCTANGLHSLTQVTGVANISITGCTIKECKNGVSVGTSTDVAISNNDIDVTSYGVRANGGVETTMTMANNTITADLPVVVRKTTHAYNVNVTSGTYTALNDNPAVTFTTDDDGTFVAPTVAATAKLPEGVTPFGFEAKLNNTYHTTFANAYEAAQADDVITLLKDQNFSEIVKIEKAITLDLNSKIVTSTAKKAFEVYANATIKNGTINGANRCVDTRTAVELTLDNVSLIANEYTSAFGNPQPLTIGGSDNGTKVTLTKVNISAEDGYGIISFVKTELTADANTNISGYSALYVKPGSEGSTFNFNGSTLSGSTAGNDVAGNSFSTIAVRASNVTINADASSSVISTGSYCHALSLGGIYAGEQTTSGNNVTIAGTITGNIVSNECIDANTVKVRAEYKEALEALGYATSVAGDGLVKVEGVAVAKIGTTPYSSLAKAIKEATANQTITLLRDIEENVTINKNLTIDGADFKYTGTMTGNDNLTITVKNVNFVNGGFAKNTKSTNGKYTFTNCTFDGANKTYAYYPLKFVGANTITVENCTVKYYLYSFLYVSSATINVNVKNVTVEDCPSYAIYFASGVTNNMIENLTVKNSNNGVIYDNTAKRELNLRDCIFENVNTIINHSKGTKDITCNLFGVNEINSGVFSQYAKIVADAQIGTKIYEKLALAFENAQGGDEIKLLNDVTLSEQIQVKDQEILNDITLNGNDKTITANLDENRSPLYFGDPSTSAWATGVKIKNLTVTTKENTKARFGIFLGGGTSSELTNVKVQGTYEYYGINLYGTHGATMTNCDVVTLFTNAQDAYPLSLENTHIGHLFANKSDVQEENPKVFADDTTVIDELTFWGESTVMISPDAIDNVTKINEAVAECNGIYYKSFDAALAAEGTVKIINPIVITENKEYDFTDETIVGDVYPLFRIQNGATMTINGTGYVTNNSDYVFVLGASDGSSIGNLTINGGTFLGATTVASVTKGALTINGGDFSLVDGTTDYRYLINCIDANYANGDATVSITGGKFHNWNPQDNAAESGGHTNFCADRYAATETGENVYEVFPAKASIGEGENIVYYVTLAEAVEAAQAGETVKLIDNETGSGIVINKNVTIDFGGFTYSFNEGVGSANTQTNGFQILKDNDVTLKNGTLEVAEGSESKFAMLIQNYANLTVTDMTLDGNGLDYSQNKSYVFSNNYGTILVNGGTNIYANESGNANPFAFDVYAYTNNSAYPTAPTMTIETTGEIVGKFEVYKDAELNIKAGTFKGDIDVKEGGNLNISGGKFTTPIQEEWCAAGYIPTDPVNGYYSVEEGAFAAIIGTTKYATLAKAITAATAGDEIVLLRDIEENVTVSKSLTIDGGGYNSTGLISTNKNVTYTFKNFNIDGASSYFVKVIGGGGSYIFDNCNIKNSWGIIYTNKSTNTVTIKNSTVDNCSYGVGHFVSLNSATLENVTVTNSARGLMAQNQANSHKIINFVNCNISATEPVYIWEKGTETVTFNFKEINDLGVTTLDFGQYAKIVADAQIGTKIYGSFDAALAAEGTVKIINPIVITENKEYDFTDETIVGDVYPLFRIQNGATMTVKGTGSVTNNSDYVFVLGASDGSSIGNLTINGGRFHGATTVANVTKGALTINGGEFSADPYQGSYAYLINCVDANYANNTATVSISGGKFHNWNPQDNAAEGESTNFCAPGYAANEIEPGVYEVVPAIARIGEVSYPSIQAAINAAVDNDEIVVLQDVTLDVDDKNTLESYNTFLLVENKTITIDLNGYTIVGDVTGIGKTENIGLVGLISINGTGNLTLNDEKGGGTIKIENATDTDPVYSLISCYDGTNNSALTINGGNYVLNATQDCLIHATTDETVVINGGNFYLGNVGIGNNGQPWIFNANGKNQNNVVVNGGTFNFDINHQFWANEVYVPETKALSNNNDGIWTVVDAVAYVTEKATSTGATARKVGYATLAEAVNPLGNLVNNVVTVVLDIELESTLTIAAGKEVVLDLNGKTITGTDNNTSGNFNLFINKGTFTVKNGTITLAATTDRGWSSSSSVISNEGGNLTVDATIQHLGGTSMAYGIDNNSTLGETTLTVEGGKVASTYRAIRQFQNSLSNNIVVVNDGTISARAGIWMHQTSTSDKELLGTLTVNGGNFECVANAIVIDINGGAQSNVTINGGTFSNTSETANLLLIWPFNDMNTVKDNCSAVMNINGGNFTCTGEGNLIGILYGADTNGDVVLTGGTYSEDVNDYCAEGYSTVNNNNDTWTVLPLQSQQIVAGWNWYSSYLNIEGATGLEKLQSALTNGGTIKAQNGEKKSYEAGAWRGTLNSYDMTKMYMVNVSEDQKLSINAPLANASDYTVELVADWNWIGYPSNNADVDINVALSNLTPEAGDRIKTQNNGFAEYAFGKWLGGLKKLVPGQGYMYNNKSGETKSFVYNAETVRGTVEANVTAENNYWTPNSRLYPYNMTVTAILDGEMNDNYEIAAFVNGEVRGSARPIYIEEIDSYIFFLTIHGENVEEMTFKCYDLTTGEEFELNNRINYSNDAILGSIAEPYMFTRGTTGIGELTSNFNIYPNPTTTGTEINLQATCDKVEVFNALGVKVAEYQNVDSIDAIETAGIYVIRITNDSNVQNCRLVVK